MAPVYSFIPLLPFMLPFSQGMQSKIKAGVIGFFKQHWRKKIVTYYFYSSIWREIRSGEVEAQRDEVLSKKLWCNGVKPMTFSPERLGFELLVVVGCWYSASTIGHKDIYRCTKNLVIALITSKLPWLSVFCMQNAKHSPTTCQVVVKLQEVQDSPEMGNVPL